MNEVKNKPLFSTELAFCARSVVLPLVDAAAAGAARPTADQMCSTCDKCMLFVFDGEFNAA